jgi:peptidoglycan/xylan/chitin deacetylase (PgdA/CDA1 family)
LSGRRGEPQIKKREGKVRKARGCAASIVVGLLTLLALVGGGPAPLRAGNPVPVGVRVALLDVVSACGCGVPEAELLALRRVFDILGVPYDTLTETGKLAGYKVACTGGAMANNSITPELSNDLYDFVEMGGTLVSAGEVGSLLYPLFGVIKHSPSRRRERLTFTGEDLSLRYVDHPNERTISLGNGEKRLYDEVIWSHGYRLSEEAVPLAVFEDGSAGFSLHPYGRGKAYLLGLTLTESVLLPQIGRDFEAQRKFVNGFEPSADVIMLIFKAIYEGSCDPYVYVSPIPHALRTALVLTHDVDAQTSFVDSLKFAALEKRYGAESTFFETTKYFKDASDIGYFSIKENIDAIRELKRQGWDIGSHTVSHYGGLHSAPEGDRAVTFRSYEPQKSVTVYGEVRVSKELLDRAVPGQNTIAFRAGELSFPPNLIRVLEESGYLYDSSFAAGDVLSAFPYTALRERNLGSEESRVVEIPVTLDESMGFLTPRNVDAAVESWLDVVRENARNEGITVLLIHPSDTRDSSYKLEAQEKMMKGVAAMGGWMGDLTTFGEFWRARGETRFTAKLDADGTLVVALDGKGTAPAVGFVAGGKRVNRVVVLDPGGRPVDVTVTRRDGKLFIGRRSGASNAGPGE